MVEVVILAGLFLLWRYRPVSREISSEAMTRWCFYLWWYTVYLYIYNPFNEKTWMFYVIRSVAGGEIYRAGPLQFSWFCSYRGC